MSVPLARRYSDPNLYQFCRRNNQSFHPDFCNEMAIRYGNHWMGLLSDGLQVNIQDSCTQFSCFQSESEKGKWSRTVINLATKEFRDEIREELSARDEKWFSSTIAGPVQEEPPSLVHKETDPFVFNHDAPAVPETVSIAGPVQEEPPSLVHKETDRFGFNQAAPIVPDTVSIAKPVQQEEAPSLVHKETDRFGFNQAAPAVPDTVLIAKSVQEEPPSLVRKKTDPFVFNYDAPAVPNSISLDVEGEEDDPLPPHADPSLIEIEPVESANRRVQGEVPSLPQKTRVCLGDPTSHFDLSARDHSVKERGMVLQKPLVALGILVAVFALSLPFLKRSTVENGYF